MSDCTLIHQDKSRMWPPAFHKLLTSFCGALTEHVLNKQKKSSQETLAETLDVSKLQWQHIAQRKRLKETLLHVINNNRNTLRASTSTRNICFAGRVKNLFVCLRCVLDFIWCRRICAWPGRTGREENNLDSDYRPALMQEEGNVSMATETTSQRHVKPALASGLTGRSTLCTCTAPYRVATRRALTALQSSVWENISRSEPDAAIGTSGLNPAHKYRWSTLRLQECSAF